MKKLNSLFESEVLTAMSMKLSSEIWQILTDISAACLFYQGDHQNLWHYIQKTPFFKLAFVIN
jgi:hypothetical protein